MVRVRVRVWFGLGLGLAGAIHPTANHDDELKDVRSGAQVVAGPESNEDDDRFECEDTRAQDLEHIEGLAQPRAHIRRVRRVEGEHYAREQHRANDEEEEGGLLRQAAQRLAQLGQQLEWLGALLRELGLELGQLRVGWRGGGLGGRSRVGGRDGRGSGGGGGVVLGWGW